MEINDSLVNVGVSKYKNMNGVTCYMNSILSILQQLPIFCDYILSYQFRHILLDKIDNNSEKLQDSVIYNLYNLLSKSHQNDNKNITPVTFRKVLKKKDYIWGEHQQQDSQEFFNFLLTTIESEIEREIEFIPGKQLKQNDKKLFDNVEEILALRSWQKSISKEFSSIKMLFLGQFQKITECSICKNKSVNFETFESLSLSIPLKNKGSDLIKEFDILDCFDYYFKKEKLDKKNKMECNFCYLKNQSNMYTKLWKTPKILVIHIKRFLVNDYGIPIQKISNKINYPINNLDISKYINPNSPDKDKCKYNLIGVNNHLGGISCSYGHYISIVKNRYDNNWYKFDDDNLQKVNYEEDVINKDAYLLFYYRNN